jgi:hypothetical protein
VLLAPACTTTRSVEPAGLANARAQHLSPERSWQLVEHGESRGVVVQFASRAEANAPRSSFFSVQNPRRQELGMIDAQGRAWRYEVHQREARWLSTGTLLDGARAILGADASAVLVECPVDCAGAVAAAQ